MSAPIPKHRGPGTNSRYNQGCRCDECTEAHAHYSRGAKHRRRRELLELRAHLAELKAKRAETSAECPFPVPASPNPPTDDQ